MVGDDPSSVHTSARLIQERLKGKQRRSGQHLANVIKRFIRDAQVNYRRFFSTSEPDLFPRILQRITAPSSLKPEPTNLLERLTRIRDIDELQARLGLEREHWDFEQLSDFLRGDEKRPGLKDALAVLEVYVETLEARADERSLVARRLIRFEELVSDFYVGKSVTVSVRHGIEIFTDTGQALSERMLSSGEYHLLYLMTSALVTRRRGTVIAIDEPEMSMHLEWQRKLIPALLECAAGAEPQFIFATHSPDIGSEYEDQMVRFDTERVQ